MKSTFLAIFGLFIVPGIGMSQTPPQASLILDDQFERPQDIVQYRGNVLILLYGDRDGTAANKLLGERLHVHYHPTAKGLTPGEASKAPAIPVQGLLEGKRSPDVRVVPVACIGKVPDLVKTIIRGRIKKEAPDTIVLLDFEAKMKDQFGMKEGEPNLVVIDAAGRVRMKAAGELNEATYSRLVQVVDYLRKEGAK